MTCTVPSPATKPAALLAPVPDGALSAALPEVHPLMPATATRHVSMLMIVRARNPAAR